MAIVWHLDLPVAPLVQGYDEAWPNMQGRSPVDGGVARVYRKYGNRAWPMSCSFSLTRVEVSTLKTFVFDTLDGGTLRFEWTHPRLQEVVECRFLPKSASALANLSPRGSGLRWTIALGLEVLP